MIGEVLDIDIRLKFKRGEIRVEAWANWGTVKLTLWKPIGDMPGRVEWFDIEMNAHDAMLLARDLTWFPSDLKPDDDNECAVVRSCDIGSSPLRHRGWYRLLQDADDCITLAIEYYNKKKPYFFSGAFITMEEIEAEFLAHYLFLFAIQHRLPKVEVTGDSYTIIQTEDKPDDVS